MAAAHPRQAADQLLTDGVVCACLLQSWVSELDGLKQAMRLEGLLAGFQEAPIRFPPSYRWKREVGGGGRKEGAQAGPGPCCCLC